MIQERWLVLLVFHSGRGVCVVLPVKIKYGSVSNYVKQISAYINYTGILVLIYQGPVVQSIVSLARSLRGQFVKFMPTL